MGMAPYRFDHRQLIHQHGKRFANEYLDAVAKALEPDYVLAIKGRGLEPKTIKDIPAKKILWWLDSATRYADFEDCVEAYDKYYVIEEGWGHPWMAIGIDPSLHRRIETDEEKYKSDVIFAGTAHPKRSKAVVKITQNMPWITKIWGNAWHPQTPNWQGNAIYWDELYKAYSGAKIILNAHYIKGITPNMRSIEAPASGTMMLSDSGKGLEKCLRKGKEYVAYDSAKEAKRLILKYLEDEKEREKIAKAGQRKVYRRHLLSMKLEKMFK